MAEDNDAAFNEARERLAAEDLGVAALVTAGDPGAELAVRALALNGGSQARALVDMEQHVSRGLLRRGEH